MTVRCIDAALPDVLVVEPDVHRDGRGFLLETYHAAKYRAYGIRTAFIQDNHSRSGAGTIRGLHMQRTQLQAKLVRAVVGEIFDVAVDLRRGSPTFGRFVGVTLSADNFRQCYVPGGFAHGFCVTAGPAEIEYKCSAFYDPADELGIAWNDVQLAIPWPVGDPVLSERDRRNPTLAQVMDRLPVFDATTKL